MMIWTAKMSKIKVCAALALTAGIVLAAYLAVTGMRTEQNHSAPEELRLENNADRVSYLRALGWDVEEEPVESLNFLLPETLEEPYLSYNALQLPQGFDLGRHCGEETARYTYRVRNYPDRPNGVQANLYVSGGEAIAGDIFCPGANGFQEALIQNRDPLP